LGSKTALEENGAETAQARKMKLTKAVIAEVCSYVVLSYIQLPVQEPQQTLILLDSKQSKNIGVRVEG